jgi:hypothetical protein
LVRPFTQGSAVRGDPPERRAADSARSSTPFAFTEPQDVQELPNFFERRVCTYQVAVTGTGAFDEDF